MQADTIAKRDAPNIPVPLPKLEHEWAGSEWVQMQLDYAHKNAAAGRLNRRQKCTVAKTMSPLGVAVADVLGFAWRGIYHMEIEAILRARWDDPLCVKVRARPGLATFDGGELFYLVLLAHDMMLRMEVDPCGPGHLRLCFWQRHGREGGVGFRMPTLEAHAERIRSLYKVVTP